jgi:membrane protease YdiL (CAAX protease family)
MVDSSATQVAPNRLLSFSLHRPVLAMLVLFLITSLIKILDTFVLPLNELVGELIVTKALGFGLVASYVWACGRMLRDIGFHQRRVGQSLLIGGACVGGLYAVSYAVQLVALLASGQEAMLALSAIDPKTGMAGGLLFGIWLFLANLVNSAMEEGLFRGAMLRHFRIRFSIWTALLLQAFLFALWHLNWPVAHYLAGEASLGEAAYEAFGLLLSTGVGGLLYGYLYYRTDNLWAPFLAHTINNTVLNMLFFRTSAGLQAPYESGTFLAIWLPGHLALLPIIAWWTKRAGMLEVQPWGSFEEI